MLALFSAWPPFPAMMCTMPSYPPVTFGVRQTPLYIGHDCRAKCVCPATVTSTLALYIRSSNLSARPSNSFRCPMTTTQGVTLRSTLLRSSSSQLNWVPFQSDPTSVLTMTTWTGPASKLYQYGTGSAATSLLPRGSTKRRAVGTPHSPPESRPLKGPLLTAPVPAQSCSWLPWAIIYGSTEDTGSIAAMNVSHLPRYPVA
mmetsp:Transcript_4836/g.12403  ORF Transcript_4836/g.12403 Transcript_4836/m.12403 type:complete len:201 (+) Transcript_4836:495-1097(+)